MKKAILFLLCIVLLVSSFCFAKPNRPNVPSDSIPYVIITTGQAKSAYQELADWKTKKGTPAVVETMSYILTNYTGIDSAEKVRNYIKSMYNNKYTRWILLGGDVSEVPTRYARVWLGSSSGDLNAISDYYYSCLDGDWNYDEDSLWGELEDSVDLNPEVYVGRIPTGNPDTVSYVIDKLLSYEKESPYLDYQTKALFLTSWINGDRSAQSLRDTLATYLPAWYTQVNLDEDSSKVIDSLNSGFGLIVNYSMSQVEGNFITRWEGRHAITNSDLDSLHNQHRYGVMMNSTCLNNKFDLDCISRHFILNPNGGLVGYIGTAAYDVPRKTTGFHTGMFDQMFNQGETRIGKVLTDSKLPYIDQTTHYGVFRRESMAYLLLGDPQMEIWTDTAKQLTLICDASDSVLECGPNGIAIRAIRIIGEDTLGVPDALVCLMNEEETYEVKYTSGSNGVAQFSNVNLWMNSASLVASKKNFLPAELIVEIRPLKQPTNLTASYSHLYNRITLNWTDRSANETGYEIWRRYGTTWWSILKTLGADAETYVDVAVECGEITYIYWVRAIGEVCNSEYSDTAYATTDTCPTPECPFLYVWNGAGFVNDNVILTGSEDEFSDKVSLTDYYLLSQELKPKDGKYQLEIREFENETSRIDHISLFAVDYPISQSIGVTPEGKVWIYSDPVSPISCVDQDGADHVDEILSKDEKYFTSNKPGYLIVNFGKLNSGAFLKPSDQLGTGGGGGTQPPPKEPPPGMKVSSRVPSNGNTAYVDVIGESGEWENVAKLYPRTRPVLALVALSQYVKPDEDFKIKIRWEQAYSADHIAYYRFDDTQFAIKELQLSSATHSLEGAIDATVTGDDEQRALLSPEQSIKLSFAALPDDSSKQRSFLFVAKGYYEKSATPPAGTQDMARIDIPTMDQNYPNPFNVSTGIRFTLPEPANVTLNIYNILGQKVATLVDEEKPVGTHTVFWDGRDKSGSEVASGIYFYQLKAGDYKELKKMLLIK